MTLPLLEPSPHTLSEREFGTTSQLLSDIGRSEDPVVAMVTCADLGCAPDQLSHANPGEIMISQNAGGLVGAADSADPFLESVVCTLHQSTVRHLGVCGHTECNIFKLLLTGESDGKKNLFKHLVTDLSRRLNESYLDRPKSEWLLILIQESVLQQLANLRSYAYVQMRLKEGTLRLHGWIRDDRSATITSYDPAAAQFIGR